MRSISSGSRWCFPLDSGGMRRRGFFAVIRWYRSDALGSPGTIAAAPSRSAVALAKESSRKFRLARASVRAVADEAAISQERANVPAETDLDFVGRDRGRGAEDEHQAKVANDRFHTSHPSPEQPRQWAKPSLSADDVSRIEQSNRLFARHVGSHDDVALDDPWISRGRPRQRDDPRPDCPGSPAKQRPSEYLRRRLGPRTLAIWKGVPSIVESCIVLEMFCRG